MAAMIRMPMDIHLITIFDPSTTSSTTSSTPCTATSTKAGTAFTADIVADVPARYQAAEHAKLSVLRVAACAAGTRAPCIPEAMTGKVANRARLFAVELEEEGAGIHSQLFDHHPVSAPEFVVELEEGAGIHSATF